VGHLLGGLARVGKGPGRPVRTGLLLRRSGGRQQSLPAELLPLGLPLPPAM